MTAGSLLKQTAASVLKAKGLSSVVYVCVSQGSWEQGVSAMRKALCWLIVLQTMSLRYAVVRGSATVDNVHVMNRALDASMDVTANVTITPVFDSVGSSAEVSDHI